MKLRDIAKATSQVLLLSILMFTSFMLRRLLDTFPPWALREHRSFVTCNHRTCKEAASLMRTITAHPLNALAPLSTHLPIFSLHL